MGSQCRNAFINTNLNTRLALNISTQDDVVEIKRKIVSEHAKSFPEIGQIEIHRIKVKRKGYFYQLSESMLVRNTLKPFQKDWFLTADVSALGDCRQNEILVSDRVESLGIGNNNALVGTHDNSIRLLQLENKQDESEQIQVGRVGVLGDIAKEGEQITLPVSIPVTLDRRHVNHEAPSSRLEGEVERSDKGNTDEPSKFNQSGMRKRKRKDQKREEEYSMGGDISNSLIEREVDGSNKGTKDVCNVGEEGTSKPTPSQKKRRKDKKKKKKETVQDDTSKKNDAYVVVPGDHTVQQDVVVLANSSEKAAKEVIKETEIFKEHLHTECNDNNTKDDIDAVLMEEPSEPKSAVTKKPKKRKARIYKELLNVTSPKDAAQISHEAHMETKESKGQPELNNDKSGHDIESKHNKTEDILDTRPAKKRKKSKEKSREKTLSYKKLPNDLNGEKSSPHLLKDQPYIKNHRADHLAVNADGANQLEARVLGQGKKGTMNSSNLDEAPIVALSRVNEEGHHFSIQREDIIMSKTAVDKMEIGTDACRVSSQSIMERKGSDIEMKVPSSEENEPKDLSDGNENIVLGHFHERGAGQTEGAEEGKEVSPSYKVNTNSGIKELKTTSNGTNRPVKSKKKIEGTEKAKNSGAELVLKEPVGPVDASESKAVIAESPKATIRVPTLQNTETDENPLNHTEGKIIQQQEMPGTDKENDISADNAGSSEHVKTKSIPENVDKHVDKRLAKKSNNKQPSTPKRSPKMLTNDQVLDNKNGHDVQTIQAGTKVPNVPKTGHGSKLSSQSDSAMSSIDQNRKLRNNASEKSMDLERQREQIPISKSNLNKMIQNKARKASRNNVGGVVSKTQQNQSLLGGAIFDDNSSGTTEGEDRVDYSDASTRTPSDNNSLLSEFSDGDSQQNGSSGKRMENGERSSLKAGLSFDHILRSSARYKRAKMAASQMDESESQQEFIPDSLPN